MLEFDTGIYVVSETLRITAGISLKGQGATKKVVVGGHKLSESTIIRWEGVADSTILILDTVAGITIEGLCFDTKSTDPFQEIIQNEGVTAIQYINKSNTRPNEIRNCLFNLLSIGVHYFDDNTNIDSDTNMDTNYIDRCEFRVCRIGVKVEQSNVYNALVSRCAFYGSLQYTKHHLLITKGHAEISDSYLGVLKDDTSVGGKDGIAVEVNQGYCNLYNIYSESHNGPFFVWNSILNDNENCISNLIACNVMTEIVTDNIVEPQKNFPTNYLVENRTNKTLSVSGGFYTYDFSQKKLYKPFPNDDELDVNSIGSIVIVGTDTVHVSIDSTPNRIFFYGSKYGNLPVVGSLADREYNGGGNLYLTGEAPELYLSQIPAFKSVVFKWEGNSLKLSVPGYYPAIEFDFANKELKMPGWKIDLTP